MKTSHTYFDSEKQSNLDFEAKAILQGICKNDIQIDDIIRCSAFKSYFSRRLDSGCIVEYEFVYSELRKRTICWFYFSEIR